MDPHEGSIRKGDEMITSSSPTEFAALTATHPDHTIFFAASWCQPCQTTKPRVAELAAEREVIVIYADVETHSDLATSFGVQTIPALFTVRDGEVIASARGVLSVDELRDVLTAE